MATLVREIFVMLMADFEKLRACRDRILLVLGEGEMTRTQLVRRCTAHPAERFRAALDMLISGGNVEMRLQGVGRRATSVLRLAGKKDAPQDPLLVRMSPEAAEAQGEALRRLNGWFIALEADKTNTLLWSARKPMLLAARAILVLLHRTPWKYAVETPVWAVVDDASDSYGHARALKALRKLAEMGAIVLHERRGRGRVSTFRLAHVPPWPMA